MPAIVDIHCHNFNADDLPVKGFVGRVIGTKTSLAKLVDGVIDSKVQNHAPGFKQELKEIAARIDPSGLEAAPFEPDLDLEAEAIFNELSAADPQLVRNAGLEVTLEEAPPSGEEGLEGLLDWGAMVKRWIKWALLFAKARVRLTEILAETYPQVNLFTPMLVDLELGLGGDKPETSIHEQLEMQDEISKVSMLGKLRGAENARVHPFVGFDPRRPNGLDLVREAVNDFGFVGVKMYPPMGFRPLGNVHTPLPRGMDLALATTADRALRELYAFCQAEQVPITAHGNPTNFADEDFERFSSPHNWRMVLTEFPELHLNLGHFGGKGKGEHPDWPHQIAALAGQFPYLHADIGNHQLDALEEYMDLLEQLFSTRATEDMLGRLMFGTDWFMVASHKDFKAFLEAFQAFFGERFPDKDFPKALECFMGGAALHFLGFDDAENENAKRLAERYADLKVETPDWLATDGGGA